jgi:hypothetical protein
VSFCWSADNERQKREYTVDVLRAGIPALRSAVVLQNVPLRRRGERTEGDADDASTD